ncbi:hypothetical protein GIB67_021873 [Kingdonia uniflora]|uniref:Uncharacterized protein n=1 Tax=Kingdonia uniflora TaxID=39325 RepID=A0A7J7NEV4_9MAGN|nr:hypothetical protein GIB67_021873 [Kingdonia uniflora]
MGRGGKRVRKGGRNRGISRVNKGSDGSDEDYVFSESDGYVSEENYDVVEEEEEEIEERKDVGFQKFKVKTTSLRSKFRGRKLVKRAPDYDEEEEDYDCNDEEDKDFTLDSIGFEEEEEEEEEEVHMKRKVIGSKDLKVKRSSSPNKKNRINQTCVVDDEEDYNSADDYDDDDDDDDDEEYTMDEIDCRDDEEELQVKTKIIRSKDSKVKRGSLSRKKIRSRHVDKRITDSDGEEDYDFEDEDEDDEDEEFMLEEVDCGDEEEELNVRTRTKKVKKPCRAKNLKCQKRKRKSKLPNKLSKRKRSAKRVMSSDDDFQSEICKKKAKRRKKGSTMTRDLDFVCSGSSDLDFTVYDEKKELLREAKKFCGPLSTSFRNSSLLKSPLDQEVANCQQERRRRKGKEKLNELQDDSGKQVCGICLSEEGNRTVRGTLNSCNHFFCFACIMEWSKVESRCPACKRRFITITKSAKLYTGVDPRNTIIQVPESDQIYQPTEEELMLNTYDNVVCVECQQDGDDSVMLLCDICDSPAHTYCVGLGRNVPEGNWFCRTCSLGSLNSGIQDPAVPRLNDPSSTHRTNRDETATSQISVSIPIDRSSFSHESGFLFRSPRGDLHASSPSGLGPASTLSGRRIVQHHIHMLLSQNRMNHFPDEILHHANSRNEAINSETGQIEEAAVQIRDPFLEIGHHSRRQVNLIPSNTDSANGTSCELDKINPTLGFEQLSRCSSRPTPFTANSSDIVSPCTERIIFHEEDTQEQEQSLRSTT